MDEAAPRVDVALLAPPRPAAGPMLERMDPDSTGLRFENPLDAQPGNDGRAADSVEDVRAAPGGASRAARPTQSPGVGVAAGDIDGDGLPDLYLVARGGAGRLFRNLGDWRFEEVSGDPGIAALAASWGTEAGPDGAAPAPSPTGAGFFDADNDGDLDLFLSVMGGSSALLLNNGGGRFDDRTAAAAAGYLGHGATPAFADVDRDGDVDVFLATEGTVDASGAASQEPNVLLVNRGNGTFERGGQAAGLGMPDQARGAAFGDVNGDGWSDLLLAGPWQPRDLMWVNRRDGTFEPLAVDRTGAAAVPGAGVDLGDIDGDGRADLVLAGSLPGPLGRGDPPPPAAAPEDPRNRLYLNLGGPDEAKPRFLEAAHQHGVTATDATWSTKLVDVDLDGRLDLLATTGLSAESVARGAAGEATAAEAEGSGAANAAFRNAGDFQLEDVSAAWGFASPQVGQGLALADFDGDGDLDVVVNHVDGPAALYRNGATAQRLKVELRGGPSNRFGLGARLVAHTAEGAQTRHLTNGGGYLSSHEPVVVFGLGDEASVERLVVDWPSGHRSVLTNVAAGQSLVIHEPDGAAKVPPPPPSTGGQFTAVDLGAVPHAGDPSGASDDTPSPADRLAPGVAWLDPDADGWPDLLVGRGAQGALLLNRPGPVAGSRAFIPSAAPDDAIADRGAVAATDMDGDGDLEVFRGGWWTADGAVGPSALVAERSITAALEAPGGAGDTPAQDLGDLGPVTGAVWTDYDADGDPDLALAAPGEPIRLLRNDAGELVDATGEAGLAGTEGLWRGIDAADLDHDGDQDLVASNAGLNARLSPAGAAASDEGPAAEKDLGRMVLAHMVLENAGGRFAPRPLPRAAQLLGAAGVALGDADNDGHEDVFLVGNLGPDEPWALPRTAGGGLLLLGDGEGGFAPATPQRTGLWIDGAARGLAASDYDRDGRLDYAVGINGEPPLLFHNEGVAGRSGLVVLLEGPPENPAGIGSVVDVRLPSGASQVKEVRAGAGFLSLHDNALVFGVDTSPDIFAVRVAWPDGSESEGSGRGGDVVRVAWSAR